jgi:ketosteroid isomerase-like protein
MTRARTTAAAKMLAKITIGTERFEGKVGGESIRGEWRATNIYRREDGGWKIVHHHTDASLELQELLRRLPA